MTRPEAETSAPPVTCIACGVLLEESRRAHPWCESRRCWAISHGEEEDQPLRLRRWPLRFDDD